jgi:hypothetical protein
MTEQQVVNLLKLQVAKARSMRQWSRARGIAHVLVWRTLAGERPLPDSVATALGLEKIVTYRRIK